MANFSWALSAYQVWSKFVGEPTKSKSCARTFILNAHTCMTGIAAKRHACDLLEG